MGKILALLALLLIGSSLAMAADDDFIKALRAEAQKDALRELERGTPTEQIKAAGRLGKDFAASVIPVLAKHLADRDPAVRTSAASTLWTLADRDAAAFAAAKPALEAALGDSDGAVAMNAAGALYTMEVPAEALAPARRRVLQQGNAQPYVLFLAARGLIGIDPPGSLAPALIAYLEPTAAAAKRGGSRDNLQLATKAMDRLVATQDRTLIAPLQARLGLLNPATLYLLPALNGFKPRPEGFTKVLLDYSNAPDKELSTVSWELLGKQDDAASILLWAPRAAALLANPERRDLALAALGNVAGRTSIGVPELAALAADPGAGEEQRLRAIKTLGRAADARSTGAVPEANRVAYQQWLRLCEPIFSTARPGAKLEACQDNLGAAIPDDVERARLVTKWMVANPDLEVRIWFLGKLEQMWSKAFASYDAIKAELNNPDPRVKQAAENALDRIRPAWRESSARQEKLVTSTAKPAPAAQSGPAADGAALYGAVRLGDLAAVKKLVTRANVSQPVRYPQLQGTPPIPLVVVLNYCGVPTVTGAQLAAIVTYLVSLGADPEAKDQRGENQFDRAKQACPPEVVKALTD